MNEINLLLGNLSSGLTDDEVTTRLLEEATRRQLNAQHSQNGWAYKPAVEPTVEILES